MNIMRITYHWLRMGSRASAETRVTLRNARGYPRHGENVAAWDFSLSLSVRAKASACIGRAVAGKWKIAIPGAD